MTATGRDAAGADVVRTAAEAAAQPRPPLLVLEPLEAFLDAHGLGAGPVAAEPIGEGHSNVTYALRRGDADLVLRRPPRPPLPPSAHDMLREAALLRKLHAAGVRVPRVLAVCEDPAAIGMPFYVMERLHGVVVTRELPPALGAHGVRSQIGRELVDALVEVHAVDVRAAGLEGLGRPGGYLERQLRRFASIWEQQRTRTLPEVDRLHAWLAERLPASPAATVVHGDFRLGNAMLDRQPPARLLAVFDWEMATLGDPLADLGYLCATWARPDDEENPMLELSAVTRLHGFLPPEELVERYALRSGRDVEGLRWYEVLALWKAAVFLESSYRRYLDGTTDDPYFARLDDGVPALARAALARTAAAGS